MERYLMISDAAKEVQVESHVLRYWEEELHLPIRRNELGHRYYTEGDVELFKKIKSMKEGGLQLKAIKMILKDGKLDVMLPEEEKKEVEEIVQPETMAIQVIGSREAERNHTLIKQTDDGSRDEKAKRLQWLLQQLIRETLQENNKELCREIKESVVKELDYQFRTQEEREEERDRIREQREEAHYQKLDELLRKKVKKGKQLQGISEVEKGQEIKEKETCTEEHRAKVLPMEQEKKRKKRPMSVRKKKQKLANTN
ncbi:MAG: MerR family transcriptional regulator [Lachnospiraceae bacterium]|nr:MerR family transcriptional regulator [Lachnospiraceae bacterium]